MKKGLNFIFILLIFTVYGQEPLKCIKYFGDNPGNLNMYIYTPFLKNDTVKRSPTKPLVVVLHGCTQNAFSIAEQSGWNKLANYLDFYVIYPEQKRINNLSNCFNWFNDKDLSKIGGESESIWKMIEWMCTNFKVDKNRIFIYGLSAGGAMTSIMMANYPSSFNAGAVLAGIPYKIITSRYEGMMGLLNPKITAPGELTKMVKLNNPMYFGTYPRLVIYHGRKDNVVDFSYSKELIKQWSGLLMTDTMPTKMFENFTPKKDIVKMVFTDKKGNDQIYFYDLKNIGHELLIDPGDPVDKGGKLSFFSKDIDFHSTYWIAKDFGLIK